MSNFSDDVHANVVYALVEAVKAWAPGPDVGNVTHSESYDEGVETGVRMTMAYLNDEEIDA